MGEIRDNVTSLTGRIAEGPAEDGSGVVHFTIYASETDPLPYHCICSGVTATNMMKYIHTGDEVTVEGSLLHQDFPNVEGISLVVCAEHVNYGRKVQSLFEVPAG